MPETSIIMTSYNYEKYISQTIDSVINQTYSNWELIIVDDGSEDNSIEIINSYIKKHPDKISLYTHPNNQNNGIIATNMLGFSKVKGKYIAFLESDDYWHESNLEKKVNALKKYPQVSLVFSDVDLSQNTMEANKQNSEYVGYSRFIGRKIRNTPKDIYNSLLLRNSPLSFSNVVVRRDVITDISFCEDHAVSTDWQFNIQASIKGEFFYIDEQLFHWRRHNQSTHKAFMREVDPKAEYALLRICFNNVVKNLINRNENKLIKRCFFYPLTLQFKIWQILHELKFLLYRIIHTN